MLKLVKACVGNVYKIVALIELINSAQNLPQSAIESTNAPDLAQLLHHVALSKANKMLLSKELFLAMGSPRVYGIFFEYMSFISILIKNYYCICLLYTSDAADE